MFFYELGILNEGVAKTILRKSFTEKITPEMNATWYERRRESVRASLKRFLLVYLGEPLNRLIRYVGLNFMQLSKVFESRDIYEYVLADVYIYI